MQALGLQGLSALATGKTESLKAHHWGADHHGPDSFSLLQSQAFDLSILCSAMLEQQEQ